uniref:G-patch domain-containing protein n=1 Tax=Spongospora subterranea TaxID=70186 RepID=A0A0H5RAF7_9EUKA|eukprot:CRZ10647.1 hypothetical protein [Spongospora subterranea]
MGLGTRHGASFWDEEKGNVGYKLMQNMGWTVGTGLGKTGSGTTQGLRVKKKKGMEGIGVAKDDRDDMWSAATSAYNDLLKRLNSGAADPAAPDQGNTLTTIQQYRSRTQLYTRFKRGKDISAYSANQLDQILGRRSGSYAAASEKKPSTEVHTITNKKTIEEYFRQKRLETGSGISEQERIYDELSCLVTTGRGGLGSSINRQQDSLAEQHLNVNIPPRFKHTDQVKVSKHRSKSTELQKIRDRTKMVDDSGMVVKKESAKSGKKQRKADGDVKLKVKNTKVESERKRAKTDQVESKRTRVNTGDDGKTIAKQKKVRSESTRVSTDDDNKATVKKEKVKSVKKTTDNDKPKTKKRRKEVVGSKGKGQAI